MTININTTEDLIFKQWLTIISPIYGKNKLKPIEIDILSKLLLIDYKYKHLSEQDRETILFNQETKKRIRQSLGLHKEVPMSEATYNNTMMSLRKKKFVTKHSLLIKPEIKNNKIEINFNLTIKNE